mmetsp:Transcript_7251/g.17727  ORF Transcript_7251/g.17727 Transcript_7251/m.17727 type:complete len:241 (-) Transcript_7251:437-1159(-)
MSDWYAMAVYFPGFALKFFKPLARGPFTVSSFPFSSYLAAPANLYSLHFQFEGSASLYSSGTLAFEVPALFLFFLSPFDGGADLVPDLPTTNFPGEFLGEVFEFLVPLLMPLPRIDPELFFPILVLLVLGEDPDTANGPPTEVTGFFLLVLGDLFPNPELVLKFLPEEVFCPFFLLRGLGDLFGDLLTLFKLVFDFLGEGGTADSNVMDGCPGPAFIVCCTSSVLPSILSNRSSISSRIL